MKRLRRPERALLYYYLMQALLTGPGFVFLAPFQFFRYRTLRYIFDDEGITMRWGVLFRREITLTYTRIQDIHLVSNVIERWLGLGRVQIQTASGSAAAEITIEGLPDFEELRDELYARMRGAGDTRETAPNARVVAAAAGHALGAQSSAVRATSHSPTARVSSEADIAAALTEAAAELRALREELARRPLS